MQDTMLMVANLMALSATTAPKTLGQDYVRAKVISGGELAALADAMESYGKEKGLVNFDRDAENIRRSDAMLFLYLHQAEPAGLNCGACGHDRCPTGPSGGGEDAAPFCCAWRMLDLGIALGSAAKTAGLLNADNRIMGRPGTVAKHTGMVPGEMVIGIPISATSKNIYFDRPAKK